MVASGSYAETLRQALVKHKEHGQLALARPLGALLAAAVRELQPSGPWLIVPCPSAVVATRQRGHQHMRRVASAAAGQLRPYGAVTVIPTLRVSGPVTDQVGLTAAGRRVNLAGAFVARGVRTHRCPVIIADDIATTGATLTEAQRALAAAGWQVGGGAVIARTPARSGVAANARLG